MTHFILRLVGISSVQGRKAGAFTYLAWVTRPEDKDLRDFISGVIREMRGDGRLYALQEKWFGFRMEIPDEGYLPPGAI